MFDWFARQLGADTAKFSVINTATPGLIGYALADRAAAVQLWEPAYTTLLSKKRDMRTIDLAIADSWKKFTGSRNIPYLGVAAHVDWAEKNQKLIPKLYAAYKEAAEWVTAHPDEAAKLIAPKGTPDDQKAIADLIRANDRLGMNVQWASDVAKEINSVYAAGKSIAFLPARSGRLDDLSGARQMSEAAPQAATVAAGNHVARGGEAVGIVGAAVRRGDPALAIRLAVFPALPVSVADRRVLALPRNLLQRIDVRGRAGDDLAHSGRTCRRLHRRRRVWRC